MTDTGIRPAAAAERPAHRDGNVLRWLGAYAASTVGDSVYYLALSWAAVRATGPGQAGLVLAASAVPRAALMLGGGVVADRFGPRKVVIGGDAVRCAMAVAAAGVLLVGGPHLWLLAALSLVFGAVDALFLPAVGALPARITGRGQLARVQGMRGLVVRLASVVGAPLGGFAVALGGAGAAFGLAGLLFAASLPLLIAVRIGELPPDDRHGRERGPWSQLADGMRYIRGHSVLAPLVVVIALADLGFTGPANMGLALLADERGWGAFGTGLLLAGFGTGAGLAALFLTVRGRVPRAGLTLSLVGTAGAGALAVLAWLPRLAAAVGAAVLVGLFIGLAGALCGALAQAQAEAAYLGRVTAVAGFFSVGVAPLTYPLTGLAAGQWGTAPVLTASAAVCALAGVYGLRSRPLRRAEL